MRHYAFKTNISPADIRFPEFAREVIDALHATSEHEITILSRNVSIPLYSLAVHYFFFNKAQEAPIKTVLSGVHWRAVNYNDQPDLVEALRGTHTILSFLQLLSDPESKSQKTLIDAAIVAGVKRFAPSEYGRLYIRNGYILSVSLELMALQC